MRPVLREASPMSSNDMQRFLQERIDMLTEEIALWLPELGEEALMRVYEERARWGEILESLGTKHVKR